MANIASCQTPMAMAQSSALKSTRVNAFRNQKQMLYFQIPCMIRPSALLIVKSRIMNSKYCLKRCLLDQRHYFLEHPAFGDGQLAYMRLVSSLYLGAHPVLTLERNSHAEPWPILAAGHAHQIAQHELNAVEVNIPTVLGGHSLGGVLAMETASRLENDYFRKAVMLLFDAPHPVQFKPDWHNISDDCDGDIASWSTGLTYMGITLTELPL